MTAGAERPLAGVGVLVTRPVAQADGLAGLIEAAGGRALRLPLLDIVPVEDSTAAAGLLNRPEGWDWLIFVSVNAVRYALPLWNAGTPGARVAAIGRATGDALGAAGRRVDLIPKPQFNSESLLAMPELAEVAGQRILIVRGQGGREHLAEALEARGAETAYAEVYRRQAPASGDAAEWISRWRQGEIDVVTVTSGETLVRLMDFLGPAAAGLAEYTPLVVMGERVAALARDRGWRHVASAEAGDAAILDAVIRLRGARDVEAERPKGLETSEAGFSGPTQRSFIHGDTALVDEDKVEMPATGESTGPATEAGAVSAAPPEKARSVAWVGYLILLVVVVLAAGGWFLLKELRSKQAGLGGQAGAKDQQVLEVTQQLNAMQTAVQSELATLHSEIATIQSQVSTEDAKVERLIKESATQLSDRLTMTRTEFNGSIQHIQRQLNKTRGDLLVADAEYLLGIANQKLHLVGDVKSVLAAMEGADQRLYDSGDPAVFKVREALAEEIGQIKRLNAPDVVGIASKLLALENKARALPLFLPHAGKAGEQMKAPESPATEDKGKEGVVGSALENFKELVKVRRSDRPVSAILTPEQAEALREVLQLKLETTRAALLRGDESLYHESLSSARDWVKEHFDTEAETTKEMLSDLDGLLGQPILVSFPDISKSLTLLRNIERLRLEAEEEQAKPKSQPAPPADTSTAPSTDAADEAQPADEQPAPEPGAQP